MSTPNRQAGMNANSGTNRVIIIGAGMGGLAASIALATHGYQVMVLEKSAAPGGKMRQMAVDDALIDGGPTVFTMKWVFDRLLAPLGLRLEDEVGLKSADLLARHFWQNGSQLDLFADIDRSADAIARFSDQNNADGYRRFCADSQAMFETLKESFIAGQRPSPVDLVRRVGFWPPSKHFALKPFSTLWSALGTYFSDPRLQQLFGRYSTYVGSSPFLTPATLMLVAHVEQDGVWMVDGGMHALAQTLMKIGTRHGVHYRFDTAVSEIVESNGAVSGVRLADGDMLSADAVIFNGDVSALGEGVLGKGARTAVPAPVPAKVRSLSAVAINGLMRDHDVPLAHHTVFFSDDYRGEFDTIFKRRAVCVDPTVYICAQDRQADGTLRLGKRAAQGERFLMLINAPADGDAHNPTAKEIDQWLANALSTMTRCGMTLTPQQVTSVTTTPPDFAQLFPGSGGALYGRASHGFMASFKRPGARTKMKGLYLAGGSVHPGPGVPMATLSGILAAECLASDLGLTWPFRPAATSGGTSMG